MCVALGGLLRWVGRNGAGEFMGPRRVGCGTRIEDDGLVFEDTSFLLAILGSTCLVCWRQVFAGSWWWRWAMGACGFQPFLKC